MANICSVPVQSPALAWQPSLLSCPTVPGGCEPDDHFRSLEHRTLDDTSWLDHAPGWLRGADELFEQLRRDAPWEARTVGMYGRIVAEPRLTAWWGRAPDAAEVPDVVALIARALTQRYGTTFDAIAAALYRDGADSVAMHSDRAARAAHGAPIAIVSLGEPRRFVVRDKDTRRSLRLQLHSGDLLVMGGACQQRWDHGVPKVARAGPRISLQLRHRGDGLR